MPDNPIVSIIIPIYNVESLLPRFLDSLSAQSFKSWEAIMVDDASVDGTVAVAERYVSADNRFILLHNPENLGQMRARETGYKAAGGSFIMFADGDDRLPPDAVSLLYDAITGTGSDIVSGAVVSVRDGDYDYKRFGNKLRYGNDSSGTYKALLRNEMTHSLWNKIFKADLFRDPEPEAFDHFTNAEDALLLYQLVRRARRITAIPDVVYEYHYNSASSTGGALSQRSVRSHIAFQKKRLSMMDAYPDLHRDTLAASVRDLSRLCLRGVDRQTVNQLLGDDFPVHLTVPDILRYGKGRYRLKGIRLAYLTPLA